mmetsp:Transcript_12695/g.16037  ORF Transcript_12695/g.16037 Transcript_12695/m.16037 type:complete len:148 (-) Transcript_12695:431-874(-)|eukprot:CAMPEP_0172512530 /NCGR_PEP_ID=MMETSP1066-20121228/245473_1 /TAXON_ID=671091 /ORGANISM="Coscinodiscus wailesii, Strain CCMP2513" /LENGTH=147 /DNA_ID=CAMNT_0013292403 /DNA_START=50 /DNA_END=493 /DNA_ORIENTATION=+
MCNPQGIEISVPAVDRLSFNKSLFSDDCKYNSSSDTASTSSSSLLDNDRTETETDIETEISNTTGSATGNEGIMERKERIRARFDSYRASKKELLQARLLKVEQMKNETKQVPGAPHKVYSFRFGAIRILERGNEKIAKTRVNANEI